MYVVRRTYTVLMVCVCVCRMPAGADNPPSLKISHNTYEQEEKADWEFMRLSLPVSCNDRFIT